MTRLLSFACFSLVCAAFASTASAQLQTTNDETRERVVQLERQIYNMQQQLSRNAAAPAGNYAEAAGGSAALEVRITELEEQMRDLRGRVEQAENLSQQVMSRIESFQSDAEFRLGELENKLNGGGSAALNAPAPPPPVPTRPAERRPANPAQAIMEAPEQNFDSPREHYNYAFRLLNQSKYDQAADSFYDFINKYPNDPLIGNAWYWGGEAHYIQRDFISAADIFRQGFEAMPEGPKAADNLFKLALSLDALDRRDEGCVVLQQVVSLFKRSATNVVNKAEEKLRTMDCRG